MEKQLNWNWCCPRSVSPAGNLPGTSSDSAGSPCSGSISQCGEGAQLRWCQVSKLQVGVWGQVPGVPAKCFTFTEPSGGPAIFSCPTVWLPKLVRPSELLSAGSWSKVWAVQMWCAHLMCRTQAKPKTHLIFIVCTWRKQSAPEYCFLSMQQKLPALQWEYSGKKFKKKLLEEQRLDCSG